MKYSYRTFIVLKERGGTTTAILKGGWVHLEKELFLERICKFLLTSRTFFAKIHKLFRHGGIAQLARACGSYPQCPRFKSRCRYQIRRSRKTAPFIWPGGQAVKTPPFHGGNTSSILVRVMDYNLWNQRLFFCFSDSAAGWAKTYGIGMDIIERKYRIFYVIHWKPLTGVVKYEID